MMCFNVPATCIGSAQINLMQNDVRTRRNIVPTRRSTMLATYPSQPAPLVAFAIISLSSSPDTIPTAARRFAMS